MGRIYDDKQTTRKFVIIVTRSNPLPDTPRRARPKESRNAPRMPLRPTLFLKFTRYPLPCINQQFKSVTAYNRGNALRQLKQQEEAINSYNQAIKLKPGRYKV
ncbi:MAG: tetratricopeptide repeat protein [Microcoleaceae cyanobacterium]